MSTTATSTGLNPIRCLLGWLSILVFLFSTNVFAGQVNLAWNASTSTVSGYKVYYGTASGNYASNVNVGNATTSTVSNLTDGSTYYFAVKAYDSAGNESGFSNEVSQTMAVAAPVASFSADKTSGTAPVTVNLADTSTGTITSRVWDLGDGTTSTAQSVAKTYNSAGNYTVTLTVGNSGGTTTATKTISVTTSTATAPVASFSATPTSGTAPLLVTLSDTSTGTVSIRTWDLGDGTTSTAQSVAKTYNSAGSYTVKLTVSNSGGSTTTSKTISATASTPTANFTASPTSGAAPLPVTFSNSSTNAVSYSWNFGDGTTDTGQNPSHTYANAGTYTVTLTATGSSGTTPSTKTQTITVSAASASTGGLVAAYNFNETSGTTVVDASGNGNNGIISGTTRTASGKFGSALSFDGISNWVTVNDSASLDPTNGMTLEAWVYPTATMSSWRSVLLKEQTGGLAYALYANSDSNQAVSSLNIGGDKNLAGGSALATNAWVHLATTYDGTTQRLYINGNQVASNAQAGSITVSDGVLRIGGNSVWGEYFKGNIDEIRIYNRALSAGEIQTDMNTAITTASSTAPATLLGNQTIGSLSESLPQRTAAAYQTVASATGQVTSLSVYVDTGSTSTKLVAGIYADNNGHPGALLAQGALSSPVAKAWNKVSLSAATTVNAGTTYWIAILSPSGTLQFRDKAGTVALPSETHSSTRLTALPSTWRTGTISAGGPLSGYGVGY
ncbi:MAG TPA: PKD domain-containing protein [Candidatus Competibacter sp.]|nr:PKD domain-containing protein [Candidatus Competibacter sp.]